MSNFDSSSDKTKDRKVEVHPQIHVSTPGIQIPPGQQARFAELLSNSTVIPGGLKPQVVSARPLAPAPGIAVATAANVGGKIIGASQHALVPKATGIKAINSSTLEAIALQQQQQQQQQHVSVSGGPPTLTQTVAVNLSTQTPPGVGGPPNTQALHITMTTVSSQSLHSLTLPAALGHVTSTAGLVQHQHGYSQVSADKDKSRVTVMTNPAVLSESDRERLNTRIQMESLIRSAVSLPQPLQKGPAQVSLTLAQPAAHQHQPGHGGGAGPTQTSIIHAALPPSHIPRGPAAASALAATKVNAVATPIIRTQALPTASLQGNTLLPTIAAQMAPQAVWKRRTATPPITTTSVAGVHSQQDVRQGHIMTSLPGSVSGGPPAVQISGIAGRPAVLSQQKAGLAVTQAGVVPHGYTGQTQKVVVTQSSLGQTMSQLLAPGSGGPTLVNVSASKIAGQGIALNLAPQQAAAQAGITTQKIITTPVTSLPNQPQGSLANLGPLSLAQPLARGQKVVVPQATNQQSIPPGAVVVNTTAKHGVNVGQAIPRQQKVIMAPTSGMPASIPVTIATVNKTIGIHGGHSTSHLSNISTTTQIVSTQNVTTLPLKKVKVQPQRTAQPSQMAAMALSQHPRTPIVQHQQQQQPTTVQTEHHPATSRDPNTPTAGQVQSKLTLPTSVAPFQGQLQASLFGLQSGGVRVTTANAGAAAAAAATLVGNLHHHQTQQQQQQQQQQQGPQGQERSTLPQTLPFNIPEFHPMYPIVYQTQHPNAGSTIRPGLVAGQPAASLAATLQAATTAVTTVTTTQAGVRLNPSVMVNVDSGHHNTISLGAAQYQGAKPSDVPHIAATNVTLAQSGPTSHPTNLVQATMAHGVHQAPNQQPGPAPSQPTNASPRPSILRKRPHEGERVMIVKRNLLSSVNAVDAPTPGGPPTVTPDLSSHPAGATLASLPGSSLSSMASPKPSHMCDPSRENSQSSTDTASSAESTPQSEVKVKQEPLEVVENGAAAGLALFGQLQNNIEASPRKKPRKQQLDATQELKDGGSSDEELATLAQEDIKQELEWMNEDFVKRDMKEYIDEEGVRWTRDRQRPPVNLLNHYTCNWKTNNNHFQRYQDVKIKDERRPTVNELANQKGIHQKASGWKVYHLAAQLEELMDSERDVFRSMSVVQECIAPKHIAKNPTMEDDISMVHELTQGNIQRCQLVMDQLDEAKSSMVKVLEHKRRIVEIINKHHSKRPVKKKERP